MAFDEVRLSQEVERGASGGPGFKTRVSTLESGFEKRNEDWAQARGRWDIAYGVQDLDESLAEQTLREINAFFSARRGRLRGFRFKDFFDFEIGDPASLIDGVVDATAAVDTTTGIATPTTVPLAAELVQVACEFDVPVRFDTDQLNIAMQLFNVGSIPSIEIVELRIA